MGVLLEHEAGGAGVPVVEQGALERLAGQGDQAAAVALGRLGQALLGGRDQGGELLAAQQAGDDARVAAFGQGRGAGAHAGGEAVGDPQPVAARQLVPRPAAVQQHGREALVRGGADPVGEPQGHGRRYRGIWS